MRPRDPRNIGAVARAMKNFGFRDLWVVTPHPPVWDEIVSAPNAMDVLTNTRIAATLAEAIADCNLVVGTGDPTRGNGLYTPRELTRELQHTGFQLALVFGPEKHGLTNADLGLCHRLLAIPTQPDCPSMNLGQAVAVCLYELTREVPDAAPLRRSEQATAGATEATVQLAMAVLRQTGFLLPGAPDLTPRVRTTLLKYGLSKYDTDLLCGILRKINDNISSSSTKTHEEDTK